MITPKYLTFKQFTDFIDLLKLEAGSNPNLSRDILIFKTLFYSLARIGEFSKILIRDIDLKNKVLYIPAENTKSKKSRSVLLPDELIAELHEYILRCPKTQSSLFVNKWKNPIKKRTYQFLVKEYFLCKDYALKLGLSFSPSPHNFRHGGAVFYMSRGMNLPALQQLMSHESRKTTEIYTTLSNADSLEAQRRIFERR